MEHKNIVATLFLKDGKAVKSTKDFSEIGDVYQLCRLYNDSGIDKIIVFDLSNELNEHMVNIRTIKNINRNLAIRVCAGGNINSIDDIKELWYAGCSQIIINGSKPTSIQLAKEASQRFGKDRILISLDNVDFIFKQQLTLEEHFHELFLLNINMIDAIENLTNIPYIVYVPEEKEDSIYSILKREKVRGIASEFINNLDTDIMQLKSRLSNQGIKMDNFESSLKWTDLKLNSDGMIPVIVQDYLTDEVLMLAYMNEEAFNTTINIGKMTYYSRSRNELWTKGLTSGHIQYVKSLTADCDFDTILAKVSQVGVACHTGNKTCFFNNIVKKDYIERNPLKGLESSYNTIIDKKNNPQDDSYSNDLFAKGIDGLLRKINEECTDIILATKNHDKDAIKYQISDLMYYSMHLMIEYGITWEEITTELAQR